MRPLSRVVSICLRPPPSLPRSRFALGMRASSKTSSAVPLAQMPSLSSTRPTEKPLVFSRSTMKELMPLVAGGLVGHRRDNRVAGHVAVGDELLLAVEHPLVAVQDGGGAHGWPGRSPRPASVRP